MNQIIEWLIISGVVLVAFSAVFYFAEDSLQDTMISQHDKIEIKKRQASEQIILIDVIENPLRVDVMNTGLDTITIKKLYVGDTLDENYSLSDRFGSVLLNIPTNEIVTILPSVSGNTVKIITTNNKIFSFD